MRGKGAIAPMSKILFQFFPVEKAKKWVNNAFFKPRSPPLRIKSPLIVKILDPPLGNVMIVLCMRKNNVFV
jgi:hypothetical protein